ncbi:MAG: galactonate dehydratase [Nonomuraea sp.]|nr:galactonate dehydratase [Nonomuraea sp.]NUP79432.1 galactonate dehydratase [Nonomuraea sp.]
MKIVGVTTYLVPPRWCFVKVTTDEGVTGWGEPVVEGRAHTVAAAVSELTDHLLGQDPLRIEEHWQVLAKGGFYRGGPVLSSALAGLDQALWDIAGKAYGVPVHRLLGGPVRDRVRVYAHLGDADSPDLLDRAAHMVAAGYTALKMGAPRQRSPLETPQAVHGFAEQVAAVRERVGDGIDLAIDFHGRLSIAASRRVLPLLEPSMPMFVEEPLVPELSEHLGEIARSTSIPIATGERLYSRWDVKRVLGSGVAVIQPDLSHAGGVSEVRRIAAMAEAYDVMLAPHCPLGPISLAAGLQVGYAVPNLLCQEQVLGLHEGAHGCYLKDPDVFGFRDGTLHRLEGPGLGIDIDEEAVEEAAARGHRWRNPIWRREDGSLAEW